MGFPSVTYTFANSTTADATQVNQDFTDIINGLSDGTKNINVSAGTFAGTLNAQGAVTLGASTANLITFNGSLTTSIPIGTNNSYDIGSSVFGLASVYLGSTSTKTTRLKSNASLAASITLVLPGTVGNSGDYPESDGSGNLNFVPVRRGPTDVSNYSLSASVATNALTVALKDASGSDASASSPVRIQFRNSTAATGTQVTRSVTGALSMTVSSGASLGHANAKDGWVYVYLIDNAGTVEVAVSGQKFADELTLQNTTGISGSSTDPYTLYSASSRTGVPIRFIGRMKSNQTTAGTWALTPTEISVVSEIGHRTPRSEVRLTGSGAGAAGYGTTNTFIRRFVTSLRNLGPDITYADSVANGGSFTINSDGIYAIQFCDFHTSTFLMGLSLNATQLSTAVSSISNATRIGEASGAANAATLCCITIFLRAGDVIRAHNGSTAPTGTTDDSVYFHIVKVCD